MYLFLPTNSEKERSLNPELVDDYKNNLSEIAGELYIELRNRDSMHEINICSSQKNNPCHGEKWV